MIQIPGGKEDFSGQGRQEGKKQAQSKGMRGYRAVFFIKENQTTQALDKEWITLFPPTFFLLFRRHEMLAEEKKKRVVVSQRKVQNVAHAQVRH